MKLWIRNILQHIINSIESEEDKTLPENYFKDIKIKLQQLPKGKMTEEEKQKMWKLYQIRSYIKDVVRQNQKSSCPLCKQRLKIITCRDCPIYCQTFNPD